MGFWASLQQAEFSQRWVHCAGVRTRVVEAGQGERAVLLLHGVQGHLEVWLRNLAALAQGRRVVAFDLLGHGFSDKPDRPYEIADYLEHALGLMEALGIEKASWIGSSLGGWVSARAAARHPERVDRLVLVSTAGLTADPAVMAKLKSLGERAAAMPGPEGVRERLAFVIHDPLETSDELVAARWQIYSQPEYRAALPHINALQEMARRERNLLTLEELGRIKAPTLVVWTDNDPTASLATGRKYQESIPGAQFALIPRASHIPSYERPNEFNRVVLEFLDR